MRHFLTRPHVQPWTHKSIIRLLLGLLLVSSMVAGYYADLSYSQQRRIQRLERQLERTATISATVQF